MKSSFFLAAIFCGSFLAGAQTSYTRPPITGIANVSVYTTDPAKARHFYGDFLGFPESGSLRQQFRVSPTQSITVDPLPQGVTDNLESVGFATTNVDAMRRYLLSRNVAVSGEARRLADGSKELDVVDPEGHKIAFIQPAPHGRLVPVAAPQKFAPISHHILHAGFIVRDQALENRFFRDVLGFHEAWHGGMTDAKVDWVDMQVPNGSDWLEYMVHGPGPVSARDSGVSNHLALGVPNIHRAADMLQQRGWHSSPREKAQMGRDGKWQLNLYDPDGTRIELMEFLPVETPCCSPYTIPAPKE